MFSFFFRSFRFVRDNDFKIINLLSIFYPRNSFNCVLILNIYWETWTGIKLIDFRMLSVDPFNWRKRSNSCRIFISTHTHTHTHTNHTYIFLFFVLPLLIANSNYNSISTKNHWCRIHPRQIKFVLECRIIDLFSQLTR